MIRYGNKMIAEPGHYIAGRSPNFWKKYEDGEEYKEIPLGDDIRKNEDGTFTIGGIFRIKMTATLKKEMITMLWSNDDQIAIMLNRENGKEEEEVYDFMQRWRLWTSALIAKMKTL